MNTMATHTLDFPSLDPQWNDRPAEPAPTPFVPAEPTPPDQILAALRTITPLEGLSDEEYLWLAHHGTERMGESGTLIFRSGQDAQTMAILLRGEIHVRRRQTGPMSFFIGRAGQITGKLPFSRMKGWGGDGYTNGFVWMLEINEAHFPAMLAAIPSMGQRCVSVLLDRVREVTRMEQQAEKLAALGKLAANLAHELNNPASAAQRAAAALFTELRDYGDRKYNMGTLCLNQQSSQKMQDWVIRTRAEMVAYRAPDPAAGPLAVADREAEITAWLEAHHVRDPWNIAPSLAETGLPLTVLDQFASEFDGEVLSASMATFATALRVERMAETIVGSTVRIFDLISAIKDYSYMDQAPIQEVNLAQSLETTLSMFGSRLAHITLKTEFDPALGSIAAYGSELNQVWTALIENALDAMPHGGVLTLTTHLAGLMSVVEVTDDGPGISAELQSRIFEPFFTTKAPGSGLGLGLDTAQRLVSRHSGFIAVESRPGHTCFQVRLPLDQAQAY